MVASDRNRRADLTRCNEVVQRNAEARTITLAQPADPRRQPLEVNPLARELDPAREMLVVRKQVEHQPVGARNVSWIAGEGGPPKRPLPLAEQRPDICGHESGKVERSFESRIEGHRTDVVAVVE